MTIKVTDDIELRDAIRKALKDNQGFCPCRLEHKPEYRCICQEFLEQEFGECRCGLYKKVENS